MSDSLEESPSVSLVLRLKVRSTLLLAGLLKESDEIGRVRKAVCSGLVSSVTSGLPSSISRPSVLEGVTRNEGLIGWYGASWFKVGRDELNSVDVARDSLSGCVFSLFLMLSAS